MIRQGHLKTVQLRQNLSVIVAYYIEIIKSESLLTTTLVVQIKYSVECVCVCVRTITFKRNNL